MNQYLRAHIEQISKLTDEEFDRISKHFGYKRVKKNQFLVHEGDEVKHEFLVISGIFKVFFIDDEGKEHIVQFAKENWWMSDYISYFKQTDAKMFVQSLTDAEVLILSLESRETLAKDYHKMEHFFRVKLTNAYTSLQQRISLLLSSTPQQRYEAFSKMYPDISSQIPKKYIAEYLGVSRETLSRLYKK